MVSQAHLKKHYYTWGLIFDVPSETPPPGLVKDQTFYGFFCYLPLDELVLELLERFSSEQEEVEIEEVLHLFNRCLLVCLFTCLKYFVSCHNLLKDAPAKILAEKIVCRTVHTFMTKMPFDKTA